MTRPVAVITGASAGVGLAAARALLGHGWRVIATGRNPDRCAAAEAELAASAEPGQLAFLRADLALLGEARRLAREIAALTDRVHLLANNAGGMTDAFRTTAEGLEENIAGNFLGPWVLTEALLPLLRAAAPGSAPGTVRIINTSSDGSEFIPGINHADLQNLADWNPGTAYCTGKLANVLHARALAGRLAADGIVAHAFHPGTVDSNFFSHVPDTTRAYTDGLAKISLDEGADTLVWLATSEEAGRSSGGYWHMRAPREPNPVVNDPAVITAFVAATERLVATIPD
ncbi:MAG: SDR family NAD(P)-dependent oxidoreductase [Sphingomonadales bacterium]|nr:SDR family NAD(P)-dependent oxidoreductase [Sphingomonadales bacterium]